MLSARPPVKSTSSSTRFNLRFACRKSILYHPISDRMIHPLGGGVKAETFPSEWSSSQHFELPLELPLGRRRRRRSPRRGLSSSAGASRSEGPGGRASLREGP